MTTTITYIDCVVTTPPPFPGTFSGGHADSTGSCAAVAAQYPGDTVTPVPTTVVTDVPTTTVPSGGYAGISGGGENCGAGPTGSCPTTTVPVPVAAQVVPVAGQTPLAFTGAPVGIELAVGAALICGGLALARLARRIPAPRRARR
jgi:hypothetical protein